MKSINTWIAGALAVALMGPSLVLAQTTTPSTAIQALLEQIKSLNARIVALQEQQLALRHEQQQTFVSLIATLKEGSVGDQVTTLQTLLALDSSIYPEGKITGFFGKLTAQAVKRFQKKHGIEQVGTVGPKTLKKFNELFGGMSSSTKARGHDGDIDDENDSASTTPRVGMVIVCHKPATENKTIRIGSPALKAHLAHGDTQGACTGAPIKGHDNERDGDRDNHGTSTSATLTH